MAQSETFIVDGVEYRRNGSSFSDYYGIEIVTEAEKEKVKKAYLDGVNLDSLNQDDLKDFIKYTRLMGEFEKSQEAWVFAVQKYAYDKEFIKMLLPMHLSTIRGELKECTLKQKEKAEEVLRATIRDIAQALDSYPHLQSVALYTSLLAACCDMGQIQSARRYAEKAKQLNGRKENYKLKEALNRLKGIEE